MLDKQIPTSHKIPDPRIPGQASFIPEPENSGLLGHVREVKQDFHGAMIRWHDQYGDLVKFRLGRQRVYLLSHPQFAEEVLINQQDVFSKVYNPDKPRGLSLVLGNGLITSQRTLWKKQRRLMQPIFYRSGLKDLVPKITAAGTKLITEWQQSDLSKPMDISAQMTRLTLEVITQTMFSTCVQSEVPQFAPALKNVLAFAQNNAFNPLAPPLFIPTRANREFKKSKAILDNLISGIVNKRKRSGERYQDLLDVLLYTVDESSGQTMSQQQIVDEALTIFCAGHETTANALSWTWYLLSQNSAIRQKLHSELDSVLDGRIPNVNDLPSLVYTRAVLEESIRLYPPAIVLIRKVMKNTEINGYRLLKGALVIVNIRNIHHHPDIWHKPESFNPERFLGDNKDNIQRLSYIPFGAGPRVCIGNHLALMEGQLLLAYIAQHYVLSLVKGHPVTEELAVTLRPKYGLSMVCKAR